MKRLLFCLFCCLWGASAFATELLEQERAEALRPVVKDQNLRQKLFSNQQSMTADFDYSVFFSGGVDVVLIGEEHRDSIPARDVNLMVKNLAKGKVKLTHVASEFLLSSEQKFLNQFARDELTYAQLKKSCKLRGRAFVAVVGKRYGVKVVGLDLPRAQENNYWATTPEGMQERNNAWAKIITDIKAKHPNAKILLHAGSYHTQLSSKYFDTMPVLLKKQGLKTRSVEFVSGTDIQWKKFNFTPKYDTLFTIPKELKPHVLADYVVFTTRADFSEEVKAEMDKHLSKVDWNNDLEVDGCMLNPDNPVCAIQTRSGRKNK